MVCRVALVGMLPLYHLALVPALVSGMAYYIAMKKPDVAAWCPLLKQEYEFQFQLAAGEDEETASIKFVPFDTFMMGG